MVRTNLATNPSFETTGSSTVVRTNLSTNPSMESTNGTSTVRTNLCTNPGLETNSTGYTAANEATVSRVVGTTMSGAAFGRVSFTGSTITDSGFNFVSVVTLSASTTYTVSVDLFSTTARSIKFSAQGTGVTNQNSANIALAAGVKQRVSWSFTTTASGTIALYMLRADLALGDVDFDNFLIESGSTALGPYFDGSTPAALRTNLCINPSFEVDTSGWSVGSAGTGILQTSVGYAGSNFYRMTHDATTSNSYINGPTHPIASGDSRTASLYVRPNVTIALSLSIKVVDISNAVLLETAGASVSCPANIWTRITHTVTAPTGAANAVTYLASGTADLILDVDALLLEKSSTVGIYFDGTTTATTSTNYAWTGTSGSSASIARDADFSYAWSGTANASTSIQTATNVSGHSGNVSSVFQSVGWSVRGTKSLRTIPLTTSGDSFTNIPVTMETGKTYTFSATIRLAAAQTGTLDSRARKIVAYHSGTSAQGTAATNASGESRISLTFTCTDAAQYQSVRLYNGASVGGGDVWWDNILVEEVNVALHYFDGATAPNNLAASTDSLGMVTYTTGVSYAGSTWTKVTTSNNGHGARALVNLTNLTNGAPYTISVTLANDQTVAQEISQDWCDSSSYSVTIKPGEIRRVSYVGTATNINATYRFADIGILLPDTAAKSILFKDWVIESGTTATDIDYTYAWTGIANASTSTMSAPTAVGVEDVPTLCKAFSSSVWSNGGGKSIRIVGKTNSSDSFAELGSMFVSTVFKANTIYTFSADRFLSKPLGNIGALVRVNIGSELTPTFISSPTNVAGVSRMVCTFTTGTSVAFGFIRLYSGAMAGNGDVWWDRIILEEGITNGAYFDGSTPALSDFTYNWSGTVNSSTSQQKGVGLPSMLGSLPGGDGIAVSFQSTEWSASGTKSMRIYPAGKGQSTYAYLNSTDIPATLVRGRTYTLMAKLRLSAPQTGMLHAHARKIGFNGGVVGQEQYSAQAPNVAGVHDMRVTFSVPLSSTYKLLMFLNGSANEAAWYDDIMLVEGTYTGDYINPTQNLISKWDGTANASTSVGYPPVLYDISGNPNLDLTGVGTSPTTTVSGFAARTFYAVYEVTDNTLGSWQVPFSYGQFSSTDGWTLQTDASSTPNMVPRADFATGGGSTNAGISHTNSRTAGRIHVISAAFNEGLTTWTGCSNGGSDSTKTLTPGTVGWTSHRISVNSPIGMRGIRGLVYWGEHDRATRLAVSRYLGNKYGANVV